MNEIKLNNANISKLKARIGLPVIVTSVPDADPILLYDYFPDKLNIIRVASYKQSVGWLKT